ncbi:ComF family protein [Patescibacteria group bacterium]|nr:ComF family protein [Patescibacteria group bacterium]MBU2219496.1 ComF family protein [Patescibacteria group bacterium]MBU2263531.1 ComF family protein [Patescibacteria group bacterium]
MAKKVINSILNFLFPQKCLGCGKENEVLCQRCLESISYSTLTKYSNIFAASDYGDETVKKAIWMLKYRGIKGMADPLAELMFRRIWPKIDKTDWLIVPIPISPKSLKKRGFNQSELIAQEFAKKIQTSDVDAKNIGCLTDALYKIKETPSQVSIKNREQRLNNLKDAFAVKNSHLIAGRNILLIDDVSTTGATIREACRVLRESGAKKIIGLVVARG